MRRVSTSWFGCMWIVLVGIGLVACHRDEQAEGNGDDQGVGNVGDGGGDLASLPPGGCPAYQVFCNGACIPAVNDPSNCGGCGNVCSGSTLCWGGKCVATCPFDSTTGQGLKACGGACVDTDSDNNNCGGCGTICKDGKVCADGQCVTGIATTPGPNACTGVGPPIMVTVPGGGSICSGNLAQTSFTWALCACENVTINGDLVTDAFNSVLGPFTPGGQGGGVGMNGTYQGNQITNVGGTMWTSATGGLTVNQKMTAHQDLYVNGPVDCSQQCTVGLDAHINGSLKANAPMSIAKTLYLPNNITPSSNVSYGNLVQGPVNVGPACACDPNTQIIPVATIVDARKSMNDNASIGLDPAVLSNFGSRTRLDLPCGNYYLDSINTNAALTIVAHGHTALYIGGDIKTNQNFEITVDPTGSFDIFVKGTIDTNQKFAAGSLNAPALTRIYLGTSALTMNQGFQLAGNLYAGLANVTENQTANIYGSIFSRAFDSNQDTIIHYDTAVVTQGKDCPGPATGPDAGTPPGCGSCADCNNQACINGVCGNCGSNADCCAPLTCVNGQCTALIL